MRTKIIITLSDEEERLLSNAIDWYDNNSIKLEEANIDISQDLYKIFEEVLARCEIEED